jgi:hypothetical protein
MKTIEEAAEECLGNAPCGLPCYEYDDYNAGVVYGAEYGFECCKEFIQRWIPVEEEMPEFSDENRNQKFLVKGYYEVGGLKGEEDFETLKLDFGAYEAIGEKLFSGKPRFIVTHWRPIEYK